MLDKYQDTTPQGHKPSARDSERKGFAALTFDPTLYFQYLAESDMSDADKQIVLEELWAMMVAFVDMGFSISPIQQAMDKSPENKSALASGFSDVVKSRNNRKINRKRMLRPAKKLDVER